MRRKMDGWPKRDTKKRRGETRQTDRQTDKRRDGLDPIPGRSEWARARSHIILGRQRCGKKWMESPDHIAEAERGMIVDRVKQEKKWDWDWDWQGREEVGKQAREGRLRFGT